MSYLIVPDNDLELTNFVVDDINVSGFPFALIRTDADEHVRKRGV